MDEHTSKVVAGTVLGGLVGWATWRSMSDERKQQMMSVLNDLGTAFVDADQRRRDEAVQAYVRQQQQAANPFVYPEQRQGPAPAVPTPNPQPTRQDRPVFSETRDTDSRWRGIVGHPSVVLILGKRGSGKSALGYRLIEQFRYIARPFVVGVPASARKLLPDSIGIASDLETVPPKSIVLVDEAYLHYHARGSTARESTAMSQIVNLSRQREQTFIFVSQEARQVDRNIASSANVLVFKDLGMLQLEFDRREFNKLAEQAKQAFAALPGDKRRHGFVYAPDSDFLGMMENELPSFWKPSLSKLFAADAAPSRARAPKRMTPAEKAEIAKEMHAAGASYKDIVEALGVSKGTVVNYLKGYPYRKPPRS